MTPSPPAQDYAGDLDLARRCLEGDADALREFDALLRRSVASALARIDPAPAFGDLVAQELRTRLLMGAPPRLSAYSGRGPLAGWLRTSAARTAISMRRGDGARAHDDLGSGIRAAGADPEIGLLRVRYRSAFEDALRVALAALPPRDRALLALTLRDGMTCDDLAALYAVGRSTAARWVAAARATLTESTHRELRRRLGLTASEIESVAKAVYSQLDVSLVRLLAPA